MPATRPQRPVAGQALALPRVTDEDSQRAFDGVSANVRSLTARIGAVATSVESLDVPSELWVNVLDFGAVGNGFTDDTAAMQKAINETQGRTLYLPKGKYVVSSTLTISDRSHHIVGDFANRAVDGGTQIVYGGTGPCIQFGTDAGVNYDANFYEGPQDQRIENLTISHGAPDTPLVSEGSGNPVYKAGAYGIWDWYSGGIVLNAVTIEKFEANYVGIQSDINNFNYLISTYSKYGLYIGPRSDQCTIRDLYSFFCDRAVTIDRAGQCRILDAQIVGCGTSTCGAIEIRQGSTGTCIERPWFEHLQGYAGTDQLSFVSVGEVAGYGAGGSIQSPGGTPTTSSVEGASIMHPFAYTTGAGIANHTRYIASVNKCHHLVIDSPKAPVGVSLSNLDALIGVQAANAPTNADTQIELRGVNSTSTIAKLFTNLGAGSPDVHIWATGPSGAKIIASARFSLVKFGAVAGADEVQISQEGSAGQVWLIAPQYAGGQTTRMRITRSVQPGAAAAAPTTGTWERGDRVYNEDATAGGFIGWVCTAGGTPGTWKSFGAISP